MGHLQRYAEFQPHAATWLCWPQNYRDWPGKMVAVQRAFAEIVKHISEDEQVNIIIEDETRQKRVDNLLKKTGSNLKNVIFYLAPTNRSWLRDNGPIFVKNSVSSKLNICDFGFNAWAHYPTWQKDNQIPKFVSEWLNCPIIEPKFHDGQTMILEGGSIDVNGEGVLITTEECLLSTKRQIRNPGKSKKEIEDCLKQFLGITDIWWLGRGIDGDDTHGHIDDFCRFVSPKTIVLAMESDDNDNNYHYLNENKERLADFKFSDGSKPKIVELPMPNPLYFHSDRLPASYANFYIANKKVLVPTFNEPNDRIALGVLKDLFPDRVVVGIYSSDILLGQGGIHCLTQEQPR